MSKPWFDVVGSDAGVRLRMSEDNRALLTSHLDGLLRLLENGVVPPGRAEPDADALLRRMFAVSEEFWARHRAELTDSGPARRVRAQIRKRTPRPIDRSEVDDWVIAFAQVRALYLTREDATAAAAVQFSGLAEWLVVALHPSSATGWPD
ncbi:hypothetical protein ACSHWB_29340 [Lentzea sp. HUAS TT2]|uniref:hypothetical protein n=1 Tax=Lentzea sp. HUAS TT2 TaxID=3447454 RepID=UPI003F6EA25C